MAPRRLVILLPLLGLSLACSGVSGLLASAPRVSYPGASDLDLDDDEAAEAFAELFSSSFFGFESRTTFASTDDSGDDVQDYFDDNLSDDDWVMATEDWLQTGEDRFFSVWTRDGRYGAVVIVAGDLDSEDIDYFEDEFGLEGLERNQTLVVTHTWDIADIVTRASEPPAEWDEESFRDLGVRIYLPGEWPVDESYADNTAGLNSGYAFLYRVDGDHVGEYSFDFAADASASDLVESFLDEQDVDVVGEIESISTASGEGSRAFFEIDRDLYGYIAVLPVEDEAIVLISTRGRSGDEEWIKMNFAVLDAVFASIRLDD